MLFWGDGCERVLAVSFCSHLSNVVCDLADDLGRLFVVSFVISELDRACSVICMCPGIMGLDKDLVFCEDG